MIANLPTFRKTAIKQVGAVTRWIKVAGRVSQVVGLIIESDRTQLREFGDVCNGRHRSRHNDPGCEVVGFRGDKHSCSCL